jgi:hypothetical protein
MEILKRALYVTFSQIVLSVSNVLLDVTVFIALHTTCHFDVCE